ncbi:MAG: Ig-like domain-containing protein [Flavitalea sp.]
MKRKLKWPLLALLPILMAGEASAKIAENFNSRNGISTKTLKGFLQGDCWSFRNFDVNRDGWNPGIEGDGAMVSGITADLSNSAGIYTPALNVTGEIGISFKYKFSEAFSGNTRRWIKVYLTDFSNNVLKQLDSFECKDMTKKFGSYDKVFRNDFPGQYKLALQYHGSGGDARIGIDELIISASPAYGTGCNSAPRAKNDNITGKSSRFASGFLFSNDLDVDHDRFKAYVVTASPDGKVVVNDDGSFLFTPKEGFAGKSASFTYKICDDGAGELCSNTATVLIRFPEGRTLPAGLADFIGAYKLNGNVELKWTANGERNIDHYDLERSLDGKDWQNAGKIKAKDGVALKNDYTYIDRVSRYTANKKDMYYRLKQFHVDGTMEFSRLLVVRVYNTKTLTMISVTPNPAKNDIAVNVQLQEPSFVSMRIMDNEGTLALKKGVKAGRGTNNLLIEGSSQLIPGLYMLEVVVNSKETMLVKLVKE